MLHKEECFVYNHALIVRTAFNMAHISITETDSNSCFFIFQRAPSMANACRGIHPHKLHVGDTSTRTAVWHQSNPITYNAAN